MEIRERLRNEQKKLEEIVSRGLDYARKSGVTEAYMNIGQSTGLSVSTLNGEVENIEFNKSRGLSVTVYSDGRRGRSSTSDLSREAVESAVDAAYSIARHTSRDPDAVLPDDDMLVPASEIRDLDLCHPSEPDSESAIELLSKTEKLAVHGSEAQEIPWRRLRLQLRCGGYGQYPWLLQRVPHIRIFPLARAHRGEGRRRGDRRLLYLLALS